MNFKLLENCAPLKKDLVLPSGCHLVKINVTKRLLDRLNMDTFTSSSARKRHAFLSMPIDDCDNQNENDENKLDESYGYESHSRNKQSTSTQDDGRESHNSLDDDLVMDVLPETTRFTTMVPINKINLDFIEQEDRSNINDEYDEMDDCNGGGGGGVEYRMEQLTMYVQKNSRLKLVLLSLDSASSKEIYQIDNLIRNVITKKFFPNFYCFSNFYYY